MLRRGHLLFPATVSLQSVYSHILASVQNRLFLSHLANWILHVASDDYEVEIGCPFHRDTSGGTREPKAGIFQSPAIDSGSLLVHVSGVASSGRKHFPNVASPKTYGRSGLTLRRVLRTSGESDTVPILAVSGPWCPRTPSSWRAASCSSLERRRVLRLPLFMKSLMSVHAASMSASTFWLSTSSSEGVSNVWTFGKPPTSSR